MKKKIFIALAVILTFGFGNHLLAQETMELTKQ